MRNVVIILSLTLTLILAGELEESVIAGNNQFTSDIYRELSKGRDENIVFSPFSAQTVLALAQSGARYLTAEELRTGLHLPETQNDVEVAFKSLLSYLTSQRGYEFHIANKLYLKDSFRIKNDFRRIATDVFNADLETIDFSQNLKATRTMNQWVEDRTQNKIRDLITPDKVNYDTKAILINALYFKGNWSTPFKRFTTKKGDFHKSNGEVVQVDFMKKFEEEKTFNYAENRKLGAQFLELPFQGREVSMVFVLPVDESGIRRLEARIDEVFLPQKFNREYINMTIPKFKIESKIDVKQILQQLGVRKAFSPSQADFSGISDYNLVISDIIQKTFIDVHESGVEAASATYAGLTLLSIHSTPEPKQFNADRPFIYYIKVRDLIVFAGKVGLPQY